MNAGSAISTSSESSPGSRSKPQLLFFCSARSGPSRRAEGYLAQVLQRRGNHDAFQLHRLDVDEYPTTARRFEIKTLPTLIVIDDKKLQARLEVPTSCVQIRTALTRWLR